MRSTATGWATAATSFQTTCSVRGVVWDIFGEGGVSPDLAERWDILEYGVRYRFHLRRDVVWHDGAPFTARDVAVTYGTALERGYAAASWLDDIREISVLDDHTVELRLHAPNGGLPGPRDVRVHQHPAGPPL